MPSLPRRIPLLPLAGLGIVLIAGLAAILLSRSVVSSSAWVGHTVSVQIDVIEMKERMAAQESAFRGFLLRTDPVLLADFRAASADVAAHLTRLRGAIRDNPDQARRLAIIDGLVAQRVSYMRDRIDERDRRGLLPPEAMAQASNGRPLAIRIRTALDQMFDEQERLLIDRGRRTQRLIDLLSIGLAATVLLVVLVAYMTVNDARARFAAMTGAHGEARAAVLAMRAEMAAREEAQTQLRQIQRMESIGQMTGGIAHDFNNMLAVIIGSLDMARRRLGDTAHVERHIANALEGAQRAATLVARLLAFSRRQPLMPTAIDANAAVSNMIDLLERTLGEQVLIVTALAPDTWAIMADPGQLEDMVINLAINARDAMEQGGELTISTGNQHFDEAYVRVHPDVAPGDYVELAVADRGSGMSEEVRARAFDPFFTTKPIGKGTGLGLSQVFGFVKQSGGHVVLDAREGGGTVVRVFLPRVDPPIGAARAAIPVASAPSPGPSRPAGGGQRILVVEDDERVRLFSVEALRDLGYEPLAAASAGAALDLLRREPDPDLLFTDVVMPGMSGPELAAIVRAARPQMRVLFTTGYAGEHPDSLTGTLDPEIGVLAKPFTVAQLAARIQEALA